MTSSTGSCGLIRCGSPPRSSHRVAHRCEIDDGGHAREILEQHAAGGEGDLLRRLGARHPACDRLDVGLRDGDAILVAKDVLEQDP